MAGWGRWAGIALLLAATPASSLAQRSEPIMPLSDLNALMKNEQIIQMRSMPSESMLPTIIVGDRVAVGKMATPMRGDVLIYNHPHSDRVMIGRVIGLAGDTIEMKEGLLYLNGLAVPREKVRSVIYVRDGETRTVTATEYRETLPASAGGAPKVHLIHEFSAQASLDETPVFNVPPGHIFLMGDNRDNAEDSRAPSGHRNLVAQVPNAWPYRGTALPADTRDDAIGFVPVENIIGRAVAIVFSLHGCKLTPVQISVGAECLSPHIGERP